MSKLGKVVVTLLNIVLAAILVAAIVVPELRWSGIVFVVIAVFIWNGTRE